jgi:hypothetical protein
MSVLIDVPNRPDQRYRIDGFDVPAEALAESRRNP